jgi:hypothetical protein
MAVKTVEEMERAPVEVSMESDGSKDVAAIAVAAVTASLLPP